MSEIPDSRKKKIESVTRLYYSNPAVARAMLEFSKDREVSPRYFNGFGKRPDTLQYESDILELVKKGATSFHCSEELWKDPLQIETGMRPEQLNELRKGWDLLIDIDCKWFDYSKKAAQAVIAVLENNGIKNLGLKFSGSKGWHILVPWKAFPKRIGDKEVRELFPELARKVVEYIRFESEKIFRKNLPLTFEEDFRNIELKKGRKCNICGEIAKEFILKEFYCDSCKTGEQRKLLRGEKKIFKCPNCGRLLSVKSSTPFYECASCGTNSLDNPSDFSEDIQDDLFDLIGLDMILVSPRHLFRMPYSLHEKTALASIVISKDEISGFKMSDANPLAVKPRKFMPDSSEGEATNLFREALDWDKARSPDNSKKNFSYSSEQKNMPPVKFENLSESQFPPSIQKILKGIKDGKKRALFILINLFRFINMERGELEKRIYDWNKKNSPPLNEGYIKMQISWSFRKQAVMPPNFDKDYYKGIGVTPTSEELAAKNPVSYMIKKNFRNLKGKKSDEKNKKFAKRKKDTDNFKNLN